MKRFTRRVDSSFLRVGRGLHTKRDGTRYGRMNDEQTASCHVCNAKALYRTYTRAGKNIGACKTHRAEVIALAPFFQKDKP